ncbi:unnamed protein product [Protopolystoma xenopodis]|uniref:Uncharacterized protein n=1 Tax=Protopolystoma xenopodis TaxID=117903 RepID=A0A3S5FE87_9PLAT|nr:unnamed protein product [Protopolystoma xenopodis]
MSNENGISKFEAESDLPLTSNILQERVQERLRAIERRHQIEAGPPGMNLPGPTGFSAGESAQPPSHPHQHGGAGVSIPPPSSDDYGPAGGMRGGGGEWRWGRGRGGGGSFFEDRGRGWMDRGPRGGGGRGPGRGGPIRWGRGGWEDRRMGGRGGGGYR